MKLSCYLPQNPASNAGQATVATTAQMPVKSFTVVATLQDKAMVITSRRPCSSNSIRVSSIRGRGRIALPKFHSRDPLYADCVFPPFPCAQSTMDGFTTSSDRLVGTRSFARARFTTIVSCLLSRIGGFKN